MTIELTNDDRTLPATSSYNVRVLINGRPIARGRVEGHVRSLGWRRLITDLEAQMESFTSEMTPQSRG